MAESVTPRTTPREQVHKWADGARLFAAEMRAQDIHVGMGSPPYCVACGAPWPCQNETESR